MFEPLNHQISRVTAGYSGIGSAAPAVKLARIPSKFPLIVTCAVPEGPLPIHRPGEGQKSPADTSDTAGTHQKLI